MAKERATKNKPKKENHYINNDRFLEEMCKYRDNVKANLEKGVAKPRIPEYIGECILLISNKLATTRNFYGYPFKEELCGDAQENCIRYIDNFDPAKSKNPFAYFTQITYYAFLRRIYGEKKQLYIKHKIMSSQITNYDAIGEDDPSGMSYSSLENDKLNILVEAFEENLLKKKDNRKQMLLDKALAELEETEKELEAELME